MKGRIGQLTCWQWAALSLPFLFFHLLLYGMLSGVVPGFWTAIPLLVASATALSLYGLVMPIYAARAAGRRGGRTARTWLTTQAVALACWLSGFLLWGVLDVPVPDGP